MQFKDAAFEILRKSGMALHYSEITDLALKARILTTTGQTPHATMGALLYTDTLKAGSRFRRGENKGAFELKSVEPSNIDLQIESINREVRNNLRKRLLKMEPKKFEDLIQTLLTEMGFESAHTTSYSGDGGIDVRGILHAVNGSESANCVYELWRTIT